MGGLQSCSGKVTNEQRKALKKSTDIENILSKRSKAARDEIKLLLLGPGESGKSTIFKQIKIIQVGGGFTENELKSFRFIVYGNCITQMKVLINAVDKLDLDFDSELNFDKAERMALTEVSGFNEEVGNDIRDLWNDSAIKNAFEQRDKFFQLNESSSFFFDNIDRIKKEDYLPTNDDILRVRVKTTGIDEVDFTFDDIDFRMTDVGGQRSERRKWIHCFDCVTVVLFVISLAEYNQTLREDATQNRMKESLLLFSEIVNSPWFNLIPFILILNKTDLFREKLKSVPINLCFEKYNGTNKYDDAAQFIKDQFLELNKYPSRKIYSHYSCAISPDFPQTFTAIKDTILNNVLQEAFGI